MEPEDGIENIYNYSALELILLMFLNYNGGNMRTCVNLKCNYCKKDFKRDISNIHDYAKNTYCSKHCQNKARITSIGVSCKQCNKSFYKRPNQIKKSKNHFCSRSCAATYNNKHKKYGTRRSKLEVYLEEKLRKQFHDLTIECNSKSAIESELDFYFPSLKLGIEINGIFHYEPIFGKDKLESIQSNDKAKQRACDQKGIDLIIIPTLDSYSSKTRRTYLESIITIIKLRY